MRRAYLQGGLHVSKLLKLNYLMVPKKGLEPPHPCEYMDLNHARLPIPPLRHAGNVQHEWPDIAKPEILYLEAAAFKSTRSSGSGDLEQRLTGYIFSGFAVGSNT
jgi:hypothetical protein